MKLGRLLDKQARYESHISFLKRCITDKVIPNGLNRQLEPTIGNHDQEFLDNWYQKLNKFSFELMGDIVKFCEKLKPRKQMSLNKKKKSRKNKKFYRLKYQPNQSTQPTRTGRTPSLDEEKSQPPQRSFCRNRSSSCNKQRPTFVQVLKGQSKTD